MPIIQPNISMRSEISCHPELCLKKAGLTFRAHLCLLPSVCLWAEHCCKLALAWSPTSAAFSHVAPTGLSFPWPPCPSSCTELVWRIKQVALLNPLCTPHVQGHWLFYPLTSNSGVFLARWMKSIRILTRWIEFPWGRCPICGVSPCTFSAPSWQR